MRVNRRGGSSRPDTAGGTYPSQCPRHPRHRPDRDELRPAPHGLASRGHSEHRPEEAVGSTSNSRRPPVQYHLRTAITRWLRRLLAVSRAEQRSAWSDSWDEFVPQIIPRGRQTGHCRVAERNICGSAVVPPAGFEPAPPPPADLVIAGVFRCPTWASVRVLCLRRPPVCCSSFHETFHDDCPQRTSSRAPRAREVGVGAWISRRG